MGPEILVACPWCHQRGFTVRGLRAHVCPAHGCTQISKQDWWAAVDKARVAAGLPEMIFGYLATYRLADGTKGTLHGVAPKSAVIMKCRLKSRFKEIVSLEELTYGQYCAGFGIPGSKM